MVVNNPNNWHWVDKNCLQWSREYFNQVLKGLEANGDGAETAVTSVNKVDGDVDVSQRKGKVISLFNLALTIGFKAKDKDGECQGTINVPELAYDTDADEIQFDINIHNESSSTERFRAVAKKLLVPALRDVLSRFGKDLIIANAGDIQLDPTQVNSQFTKANQEEVVAKNSAGGSSSGASSSGAAKNSSSASSASASTTKVFNTASVYLEPEFNTTAEQLYITLTDRDRVVAWARSTPVMPAYPVPVGSEFSLFGGAVSGKFIKLDPHHEIEQLWRLSDWKPGHYATLDIRLSQGISETNMLVKFTGVPIGEEDRVRANFEEYYVRAIKLTFGFGAVL
ncbi:hypothetical protein DIURU_000539 [Diutina rugosa]|uniref:Activator of Hsp90 ATPase AHSA1-like N-terminal domain-containing protein n=1 Tax=Diutina rugosa TaxID=5481 RepID=A0A642UXT8_DIURU|nr:uncharacterized protein DIURU_000539 [Diutina rugosa]KAA8907377.1 hypothetical protein DIURU_000539 [Diutina rugosa]